jgi:putative heme-binding domain-containing protein
MFCLGVCLIVTPIALANEDASAESNVDNIVALLELVLDADEQTARSCLSILTARLQSGEIGPQQARALRERMGMRLAEIIKDGDHPLQFDTALVAIAWKDAEAAQVVLEVFISSKAPDERRLAALQALVAIADAEILKTVPVILANSTAHSVEFRSQVLNSLGRLPQPDVADMVLTCFNGLETELRIRAIEVLTQRPAWSLALLREIEAEKIDKSLLNLNQLRRVASFQDEAVQELLAKTYGHVRGEARSDRTQVINRMRDFLRGTPGDPHAGVAVFKKVCAQCHKLYGDGEEVGPDITRNGRNDWEQLLQNVFDPSAVIGRDYQARLLATVDGRVLTGLPVEESEQRVVLKIQGGKLETIPRDQIEVYKVSEVSMMPEDLEKQLTPQELADLFAYLALDRPPEDPEAKLLPGAPEQKVRD